MSKPNRVFVRTYCESGCDCPTCHTGDKDTPGVEDCVYCQLKWAGKGQYSPSYRKKQHWSDPSEVKGCEECGSLYLIEREAYSPIEKKTPYRQAEVSDLEATDE